MKHLGYSGATHEMIIDNLLENAPLSMDYY